MKVTANYMLPKIAGLKEQAYKAMLDSARLAAKRYVAIVESLLQQTTRYWGESENNAYPKPIPKSTVSVYGNPRTGVIKFAVRTVMLDPSTGKAHFIWHILSQGRRTYVFPEGKRTPPIPIRKKRRRTAKGTLQVQPFSGYTGEFFVIHGGQTVRGVEGNQWYELAATATMKQAQRDPLLTLWLASYEIVPMKRGD